MVEEVPSSGQSVLTGEGSIKMKETDHTKAGSFSHSRFHTQAENVGEKPVAPTGEWAQLEVL